MDVAMRAASILKNHAFLYLLYFSQGAKLVYFRQNWSIWMDLSIKSMLERLVLKNAADCTSQRVKRTSGARVIIFVVLL